VKVRDIIKAIQDLNPGDKHRLRAYLIDSLTASSSTGNVLDEISERKNKEGYHCPHCESEHIVQNGKYTTLVDGEKVEKQRYLCKAGKKTFTNLTNTTLYRTRRLNKWPYKRLMGL
jgi:transposase-like protein